MKGMGGMRKLSGPEDLERVIEKSETSSSINSEDLIKPPQTFRQKLAEIIHSNKFQYSIIALVVLDCMLVIGELLIDLDVFETKVKAEEQQLNSSHWDSSHSASHSQHGAHEEAEKTAAEVLHYLSIAILSIFLVELIVKVFAMGKTFFHHKMEMADAVIVLVSFALDIASINEEKLLSAIGLLVVLRLWRLARIVNGIVLSMKTQSEKKIAKERSLKQAAEEELVKFREYCTAQEREIEALQLLLTQHGIEFQKMEKPNLPVRTIDVVAEVNQYIDATKMASIGVDPTVKS